TSTCLRARATCKAAESPAKLPPMTMTSKLITSAPVGLVGLGLVGGGATTPAIGGQVRERDVREALAQERVGLLQRAIERLMDGLFEQAVRPLGAKAEREQLGVPERDVHVEQAHV